MAVLEDIDLIRGYALGLLDDSGLTGALPTPIDELLDAAGLAIAKESHLDHEFLRSLPEDVGKPILRMVEDQELLAMLRMDTDEVHLSPAIENNPKRRIFTVGHEIGHNKIPSHRLLGYGETASTLSARVRRRMEQEANQFAAELIFQGDLLREVASGLPTNLDTVTQLSQTFGPSIRATLRRYVETHPASVAGLVLKPSPVPSDEGNVYERLEVAVSAKWDAEHGSSRQWPKKLSAKFSNQIMLLSIGFATDDSQTVTFTQGNKSFEAHLEVLDTTYNILVLITEL